MTKSSRKRQGGQLAPPTKEQQAQQQAQAQKKEFIKSLMQSPRFVAYTGGGNISRFGFASDGDMLLFLMDQVYGWDGTNPVFQGILKRIQEISAADQQGVDETEQLLEEIEKESLGANSDEELLDEVEEEAFTTEDDGQKEPSIAELEAKLALLKQNQEKKAPGDEG